MLYASVLAGVIGGVIALSRAPGTVEAMAPPVVHETMYVRGRAAGKGNVLDTTLHRAHVRGSEPVSCEQCHSIDPDGFAAPDRERCLGCHPARKAALHSAVDAEEPRICTRCHDFLDNRPTSERAWQCQSCHEQPHGPNDPAVRFAADTCGQCHTAHGQEALAPTACIGCHEDKTHRHGKNFDGTLSCLACHRQHDDAKAAIDRCPECHAQENPRVPATALFTGGHEKCTSCHEPHVFSRDATVECRSCHASKRALATNRVAEHNPCRNCHDQHDVKSARDRCRQCHQKVHPKHPADARKGACLGCHPAHPGRAAGTAVVVSCASCHRKARDDRAFHRGARCTDCHGEHEFDRPTLTAGFCLGCHSRTIGQSKRVMTNKGHSDCTRCHSRDPHAPAAPPACGSCHKQEAATALGGHQQCSRCHEQHSGKLHRRAATCATCHPDRRKGPHEKIAGGCINCHRAHGPGGVASPPACTSCHKQALPGAHLVREHGNCRDCHADHGTPDTSVAGCRKKCHDTMKDHEPQATSCLGCHAFGRASP